MFNDTPFSNSLSISLDHLSLVRRRTHFARLDPLRVVRLTFFWHRLAVVFVLLGNDHIIELNNRGFQTSGLYNITRQQIYYVHSSNITGAMGPCNVSGDYARMLRVFCNPLCASGRGIRGYGVQPHAPPRGSAP